MTLSGYDKLTARQKELPSGVHHKQDLLLNGSRRCGKEGEEVFSVVTERPAVRGGTTVTLKPVRCEIPSCSTHSPCLVTLKAEDQARHPPKVLKKVPNSRPEPRRLYTAAKTQDNHVLDLLRWAWNSLF